MEIFDLYFAAIASWRHHPGAGALDHEKLTLEEAAQEALEMLRIRSKIMGGAKWPS